ncbi:MAG: MBL fold metallo-hydrolase [Legionella longbeachae]|nr:MBL fold metallo-hydrolase [Legionella longbeachae]
MKLLFLGSASGLGINTKNFHSNMLLLTDSGKKLLIDCGSDLRFSLTKCKYLPRDVDAVYISHLHADHIGGIEWFAFHRKFISPDGSPELIIHERLVDELWNNCLSGGLKTLREKDATLDDYFTVRVINDDRIFEWEGLQLKLIQTLHFYSDDKVMPSYGLEIHHKGKTFLLTTDTQFAPEILKPYYQAASLIFHDCETKEMPSGVHAHFNELDTLDPAIKAKLWLYHYNDGKLPNARAHGFLGFVKCGQIFELE